MRRSLAAAVAAPLAALVLAGCGTVSHGDEVARVGGRALTLDMVETVAQSPAAGGPLGSSTVGANLTRSVITVWVRNTVLSQQPWFSQVDVDAVRAQLETEAGMGYAQSDTFTQQLLLDNAITVTAVNSGLVSTDEALALVAAADVYVASRYGRWDGSAAEVVTLGR